MGGSSKSQTVGYKYFASIAVAIGNRIEDLIGINFDKRGWQVGTRTDLGLKGIDCYINKPSLYGENEGGVRGNIRIHLGQDDQEADEWYQQYFPLVSAYPNQSYLVFGAPVDVNTSINIGSGLFQSIFDNLNYTQNGFYVGNSGFLKEMMLWPKRIHVKNDGSTQWYDQKSAIGEFEYFSLSTFGGLEPFYFDVHKRTRTISAESSTDFILDNQTYYYVGNGVLVFDGTASTGIGGGYNEDSQLDGYISTAIVGISSTFHGLVLGEIFVKFTGNKYSFTAKNVLKYELVSTSTSIQPSGNIHTYHRYKAVFDIGAYPEFTAESVGRKIFAVNGADISVDIYDFKIYQPSGRIEESFGALDINPIHKIREILTDDTAMNKPEADINEANFIVAANRIWSEGLGISWAITEKSCKEALDEICEHIEAGVRVNRQTGQYEVVLFRDDWYNLNTAQSFNESNIKTMQLNVANSDEIINTLNVTYYDRANIKKSAFNVAEIGLIHTVGHEQTETIDFPYFMNRRNAEVVANWKLKQLSTPAWSGAFTTGSYEARKLNRYDVIKLSWASKGIVNLPVRIMKISLGDGRDNTVTIDFVEVVPYSAMTTTTINVDPPVLQPGLEPQINQSVVFEMAYLEAVQQFGQYDVDQRLANNPDISYLMVATKRPQDNSLNALLYTDHGTGYEKVSNVDYCATADLDQNIGYLDSSFAVKNTTAIDAVATGSVVLIDSEIMVFQSYDMATKIMTVKRGALDTVPKPHSQNAVFYFYDNFASFDATQYVQSEIIKAKVLTTTPSGVQDIATSPELSLTMNARAIRPYPPANVKIDGVYYPETHVVSSDIVLNWSDRNRVQQTGGDVLGYFDASVTKEAGVTYSVDLSVDGVTIHSASLIDAQTYTITATALQQSRAHRLKIWSERDGYQSYQAFDYSFFVESVTLILSAAVTSAGISGSTVPTANITVTVDTSLSANVLYDGSSIKGKADPGATIKIEVI